jgi:hypothetical protein
MKKRFIQKNSMDFILLKKINFVQNIVFLDFISFKISVRF